VVVFNSRSKTMARIDDQNKLTPEEKAALKKLYEQSNAKHGRRFLTLTKDDGRVVEYIQREQGGTPVTFVEIEAKANAEKSWKYGRADWTPPDLTRPLPKLSPAPLWDALERFISLADDGLGSFQEQYPSFFPGFFYTLPVAEMPSLPAWQAWRALLREAWHSGFHPEYVAQLVNIPTTPPGNAMFEVQPVCDAQRAVLGMMLESWRARFCPKCGSPFVARKAADKYWPKQCFTEQRREKQRASKRKRARKRAKSLRRTKR
jgi:hypothetical protein